MTRTNRRDLSAGPECTIQLRTGNFCGQTPVEGAPFPICAWHVRTAWRYVQDLLDDVPAPDPLPAPRKPEPDINAPAPDHCKVYYLLVDGHLKIGRTKNLYARMMGYPPTAVLLATEIGDHRLETARCYQFRALRVHGREWFTYGDDLRRHIAMLGQQPITLDEFRTNHSATG